ncbi:hypothetical protein Tco_1096046 [Tanacetum coccineum]
MLLELCYKLWLIIDKPVIVLGDPSIIDLPSKSFQIQIAKVDSVDHELTFLLLKLDQGIVMTTKKIQEGRLKKFCVSGHQVNEGWSEVTGSMTRSAISQSNITFMISAAKLKVDAVKEGYLRSSVFELSGISQKRCDKDLSKSRYEYGVFLMVLRKLTFAVSHFIMCLIEDEDFVKRLRSTYTLVLGKLMPKMFSTLGNILKGKFCYSREMDFSSNFKGELWPL